ncbi:unnamed protein product [Closterium sp. NIES-53]
MAPTPTLNNGNSSNPASDSDCNTRDLAGERHKRRAEDGPPALTAVDVLLGGLEVNKGGDAQQHPSAPVAPVAPVAPAAQVATAAGAAHATDAEHTPAPAAGPSRQHQRRRTAVSSSDATTALALTQALTPDQVNALLSLLQQRPVSAQRGDPAGGLELISHALNLISGRFKVLQVEDASDFRTAKRFKLYQQKSLLTSRPFKQAVADMAAMDRAASGYARVSRGGNNAPMPFLPKRGPPPTANCRGFRSSCFHCGQLGHVASAYPRNGHGGQGPAPVV